MYSGVLLMSFVLAEYIMTNKPWTGLGTEDWAICRFKFILPGIPAPAATTLLADGEKNRIKAHIFYGDIIPKTYIRSHVSNGESTLSDICRLEEIQIDVSGRSIGDLQQSGHGMNIRRSYQMMCFGFDERDNKTSVGLTRETIRDIIDR